ncbi:MAG: hypothetical protein AB2L14_35800 [Candidatus Xenobiia bacterium LiM19]
MMPGAAFVVDCIELETAMEIGRVDNPVCCGSLRKIFQSMSDWLKRPVKVMALGCEYEDISHGLGIANVLCMHFQDCIDDMATCDFSQFDLILMEEATVNLIIQGWDERTTSFFKKISQSTSALIFQCPHQMVDLEKILVEYAFCHKFYDDIEPLFFCSNSLCFFSSTVYPFHTWLPSWPGRRGTRRYFFGKDIMCKKYCLNDESQADFNREEHQREVEILSKGLDGITLPALLEEGVSRDAAWLVRTIVPGETLEKLIQTGVRYDADRVIDGVLHELVKLGSIGYYHSDVKVGNVVVDFSGKVSLIDFGSILPASKEKQHSFRAFRLFVFFVRDLMTMNMFHPPRPILFAFFQIPCLHRKWLIQTGLDLKNKPDFKVYYEKFATRSEPWDMTFSDCVCFVKWMIWFEFRELWFSFRHLIKPVIRRTGLWLLARPQLAAYFYSILPQHPEWFDMIGKIISTGKVVSIHEQRIVQNLELIMRSNYKA